MKYSTCIDNSLNLCYGNLTISDIVSNSHPKVISTSSGAPSALFFSSEIKFCLGKNVSYDALCATVCIMLHGPDYFLCILSPHDERIDVCSLINTILLRATLGMVYNLLINMGLHLLYS